MTIVEIKAPSGYLRRYARVDVIKREGRAQEILKKASKSIAHEIKSLRLAVEVHEKYRECGGYHQITMNALITTFAIHFRNILDFMYSGQKEKKWPSKSDVIAEHFFESPNEWYSVVPPCTERAKLYKQRLNKQIAHVTYDQLDLNEEERRWHFDHMLGDLGPAIQAFYCKVDPAYRADMYQEFCNSFWWQWVRVPFSAQDHAAHIFGIKRPNED